MANSRRRTPALMEADASQQQTPPTSEAQLADMAAKQKVSDGHVRAREAAKQDVARRNKDAHNEAVTQIARRERLRQDLRKGLEF
jgi:hypothetical protein